MAVFLVDEDLPRSLARLLRAESLDAEDVRDVGLRGKTDAVDAMTTHDHNEVMSRVGIADLKAHLSRHLRRVRGGRSITVLDRDTPVARIVPYDAEAPLEVRRAIRKPSDLRVPPPMASPTDSLSILLRDRASR